MTERALSFIQIPLLPSTSPAPLILLIPCAQPRLLWAIRIPPILPRWLQSPFPISPKHTCSIPTPFGTANPCELPYFCKIPAQPTQSPSTFFHPPQTHPKAAIAAVLKSFSAACAGKSFWKRSDRNIEACWETNSKKHHISVIFTGSNSKLLHCKVPKCPLQYYRVTSKLPQAGWRNTLQLWQYSKNRPKTILHSNITFSNYHYFVQH